jgi:four helix bundle protein
MEKTRSFKDLVVWQKAYKFTLSVYRLSEKFPKEERYGITSQLRRASASIAANIAEGYRRIGKKDKLHFFNIAQSSLEECKFFIMLSFDLLYFDSLVNNEFNQQTDEIGKLLNAYCHAILQNS